MKQFYLLLSLLFASAGLTAQVYVNAAAGLGGDGTSWLTAFSSLDNALNAADAGDEIWIAAGTYVPGGDRFEANKNLSLIGGFAGDETSSDQANPDLNDTVLSGDVDGNDTPGDVTANRDDNKRIFLVNAGTGVTSFDGFVFTGGETDSDTGNTDEIIPFSGAAIQAISPVVVNNCTFTNNGSDFGAIAVLDQGANGSTVTDCAFVANSGRQRGAGVYATATDNLEISNCTFSNNSSERGALYLFLVMGITIEDCDFTGNIATGGRGAGLGLFECEAATINDCDFDNNQVVTAVPADIAGSRGGAVYLYNGPTVALDPDRIIFTECNFTNNTTDGIIGGAVYSLDSDNTWLGCTFDGNETGTGNTTYGAAYFSFATEAQKRSIVFDDCMFTNHSVGGGGLGSCISVINQHSVEVTNTSFVNNGNTPSSGSGVFGSFGAFDTLDVPTEPSVYNFDNVLFSGNKSTRRGGAIYVQSPIGEIQMNITNSDFINNTCPGCSGGAIFGFNSVAFTLDNVYASFNTSAGGGFAYILGGAVLPVFGNVDAPTNVTSSYFQNNFSDAQGGAFDMQSGADLNVANSLFIGNQIIGGGASSGGAIIANGDSVGQNVMMAYNTFVDNTATGFGDDVAVFSSGLLPFGSSTTLSMVNNAFLSKGDEDQGGVGNVAIEVDVDGGTPMILSGGGNFFTQDPTDFNLNPADILDEDVDVEALFNSVDLTDLIDPDFTLNIGFPGGNPLVDNGVVLPGIPTVDFNGLPRGTMPDIGAYEGESDVAVEDIESSGVNITFFPNPVKDIMTIRYDDAMTTDTKITLVNMSGQRLNAWSLTNQTNVINLTALPAGVYTIELAIDGQRYSKQVIKQ